MTTQERQVLESLGLTPQVIDQLEAMGATMVDPPDTEQLSLDPDCP